MGKGLEPLVGLPSAEQIRLAVRVYLDHAYGGDPAPAARTRVPPEGFDPATWLMGEPVERNPADAPLANVRSFALRLGNAQYPHMKLRLSRPPRDDRFVFSVDAHDAFLHAPPGSPDHEALEGLKRHNAAVAAAVLSAWEAGGLLTERIYLRQKIGQAKTEKVERSPQDPPPGPDSG